MKNKLVLLKRLNRLMRFAVLSILFLVLIDFDSINAQSTSTLESRFITLKNSFAIESRSLDSLKQILNERAKEIDIAKKKKDADESGIKKVMAGTVTISNKIDEHQEKTDKLKKELEDVKRLLSNKYTAEIDSLSILEKLNKYEGNKSKLKSQILALTEKKILVAPKINLLSFNPEKMLEVNLDDAKSDEEKKIYSEYLSGALTEVNNQLEQVKKLNDEVKQIITLQQKAKKFLEEAEFDSDMGAANLATRSRQNIRSTEAAVATDKFTTQILQAESFLFLLKQLDLKQTRELKTRIQFPMDSLKKELTMKEYQKLLKEVERRLIDYRLILIHKINAVK